MKLTLLSVLALAGLALVTAQQPAVDPAVKTPASLPGWGAPENPDGDCRFFLTPGNGELLISVPGANGPHDLAAEIGTINAPRVLQTVRGDFVIQVCVDGRFSPGDDSTLPGRTGYNGAGLVLMADPRNVVCLARAVLHDTGSEPMSYANFEMRSDGEVDQIGDANTHPLAKNGPIFLRLERRGQDIRGAVSSDGHKWEELQSKELPTSWPQDLKIGLVAISTSREEFNPRFSKLQVLK